MRIQYMNPIVGVVPPQNRWADSIMSPGIVGSVGDTLVTPFLKTSTIDLPRRVQGVFAGKKAEPLGSNISDGDIKAFSSGGMVARTYDSRWGGNRSFRDVKGWVIQDLRVPDKMVQPFVSSLGDYSWQNKIARVQGAFQTGSGFAKLPGEYSSNGVPRGGAIPRMTEFSIDQDLYSQNAFLPRTDEEAKKAPELKPKQPVMSFWETAAQNAGEAMKNVYDPLTPAQVKEFEDNSPMTQFNLPGF